MNPRFATLSLALVTAALLSARPAPAQTANTTNPDLEFATKAASGGHAEVMLGHQALTKTSRDDVKQFAQRMVDDHTKINQQMANATKSLNLRLPRAASGQDAANIKQLSTMSGADYDRAYIDLMVQDHRKDISDFQKESSQGGISAIRSAATQALPTLKEHLSMAENLQKATGEEKAQLPGKE